MRARSRTAAVGASGSRGPCGKIRPRGEVLSWPRRPSWDGPRSCPFRGTRSTRRPLAARNRRRYSRPGGRSRLGSAGEDAPRSRRLAGRADAPAGTETDRARSGALANRARGNLPPPPRGPVPPACRPTDEPPGPPVFQRDPHTRCHRSSSSRRDAGLRSGSGIPADAFGRSARLPRRTAAHAGRRGSGGSPPLSARDEPPPAPVVSRRRDDAHWTRWMQNPPGARRRGAFSEQSSSASFPDVERREVQGLGDGVLRAVVLGLVPRRRAARGPGPRRWCSPSSRPRPRSPTSSGARSRASAMAFSEQSPAAPLPAVECSRLPAGHTDR